MDNLTHSLVGAILGQMGLKRKTGLAMPTLIIAANIPDIDAVAVLLGGHQHLAIRRGITHGPIAMLLLPLLLWAAMLWFDRWQTQRGTRPEKRLPVHKGWLLALAYIGCLSHPLFDWFNSYGIRLLEPFSHRWFYGDVLFIVDVWIWAALIAGVWLSLRRERNDNDNWRRPAVSAFAFICLYIVANGLISGWVERTATAKLIAENPHTEGTITVVANPWPVVFVCRDVLWRDEASYGGGDYCPGSGLRLTGNTQMPGGTIKNNFHFMRDPAGKLNLLSERIKDSPDLRAFLFWSRMPVQHVIRRNNKYYARIVDQRFDNELTRGRFAVEVEVAH
jgi:inner membrane protein